MKTLLLAGVATTAIMGAAAAADMPMKAMMGPAPAYNWTGCYVGAFFGSLFSNTDWTAGAFPESTVKSTDLLGGVHGSCDYQFGAWVIGVGGDAAWSQATGTTVGFLTGLTDETKVTSLSSITGRLGYALDRWLPYAKAGGAWSEDRYRAFAPGTGFVSTANATRSGWTVGGGIEYAIVSNLSLYIEYDYYDFGTSTATFAGPPVPAMAIRERDSVVKVGGNWKLWAW